MGDLILIVIFAVSGFAYMSPTIIAYRRGHHNWEAIGAVNMFLGWTILGWIAALIWALTKRPESAALPAGIGQQREPALRD